MVAACAGGTPMPTPAQSVATVAPPTGVPTTLLFATYSSKLFGISFQYPANWQRVPGDAERYEGVDGFFEISLIAGGNLTIDEIAASAQWDKIQPYISGVPIESIQVQGQEARLIVAGNDSVKGAVEGQAWLVLRLPRPIPISGQTNDYVEVWSDKERIREFLETMRFPDQSGVWHWAVGIAGGQSASGHPDSPACRQQGARLQLYPVGLYS